MRVLVIGGTHFVGRHTVELFLEQGHELTVLNRGRSPDPLPPEVERLRADRTVPEQFLGALDGKRFDAIVDCIGYDRAEIEVVIERFRDQIKRYVLIDSVSVYLPGGLLPVDETFPTHGGSGWDYPRKKVECVDALTAAHREFGFPWASLRPAYIYGRYNNNPNGEFRFFARVEDGGTVAIPGDGSFVFHQTHGRDLAFASLAAIERDEAVGQIYNIAGAYAQTATRFVQAVGEAMGREVDVAFARHITRRAEAEKFFSYQMRPPQIYSIEKARRDLAWEPQFDIVEGLRDAYEWYKETDYRASHEYDFADLEAVLAST